MYKEEIKIRVATESGFEQRAIALTKSMEFYTFTATGDRHISRLSRLFALAHTSERIRCDSVSFLDEKKKKSLSLFSAVNELLPTNENRVKIAHLRHTIVTTGEM